MTFQFTKTCITPQQRIDFIMDCTFKDLLSYHSCGLLAEGSHVPANEMAAWLQYAVDEINALRRERDKAARKDRK